MNKRKPRHTRLGIAFDKPTIVTGMRKNADDSVTFFGADGEPLQVIGGSSGRSYSRSKGDKITFQLPDEGDALGSLAGVLARYSRIIGVDTNQRAHADEEVCVTVVCQINNMRFDGPKWSIDVDPLWALEFHTPTKPPERIGWRHVLGRGDELGWFRGRSSTLLVVDSYLDDLQSINERKTPLIDDFVLPNRVAIAYASADCASDSPLNALIARCDRLSRDILQAAANSDMLTGSLLTAPRTPFGAHRYWKIDYSPSGAAT